MERESFEDTKVAEILNQHFISIKVDREERPDIDHIYMEVCQSLTGSGGWPLSIFINWEKKPFYAGTYFPKQSRMGMTGFIELLQQLNAIWKDDHDRIIRSSDGILKSLTSRGNTSSQKEISQEVVHSAFEQLRRSFDKDFGGFSNAPKFPTPQNIMFLLRYFKSTGKPESLNMVEKTLEHMYRGGIYDHIGFGFSRYSTDGKWLVPHFEKMLYDNGLLAIAYTELYQETKNEMYARIAHEIFTYILRDMTSEEGGFYSAEDADSEGVEGKFYVWTPKEIKKILGEESGSKFCRVYDITDKGNFEGYSIPNLIQRNRADEESKFLSGCIEKLFIEREKRIHPFKDDKILVSWNGIMISALSMAGRVFKNEAYIEAAKKAVDFIYDKMFVDQELWGRYREGSVMQRAYADDYAFLIWALIELYESTFDGEYLVKATVLADVLLSDFWDKEHGGLFLTSVHGEELIIRPKEVYDGAIPSANSVAAYQLIRLARLTGKHEYEERSSEILSCFFDQIQRMPMAYTYSVMSIWYISNKPKDIIITAKRKEHTKSMVALLHEKFYPNQTLLLYTDEEPLLAEHFSFLKDYQKLEEEPLAYVCENFACKAPIRDIEALEEVLKESDP